MRPGSTAVWGLLGAVACAAVIPLEPNLLEEGFILDAAQRMLRGDALYVDILAFTGPLPYELLALLFRVFGEEIWVARLAVVALHGAATAAAAALAALAEPRGAGRAVHGVGAVVAFAPLLLFPFYSMYFYSTLAFSLCLLAAYAALRGLDSSRWAFVAGALVAGTSLCKQNVGVVLAIGIAAAMATAAPRGARGRALAGWVAGGAAVAIVTLGGYALSGRASAFVQAMAILPLSFESSFDMPFPNLWPVGRFDESVPPSQVAFYLPYFYALVYGQWGAGPGRFVVGLTQLAYALPFLAIAVTLALRLRGPLPAAVWIHLAALVALGSTLFPRTDWGHLVFALPSAAAQLLLLAGAGASERAARSRTRAPAAAAALAVASLGVTVWLWSLSGPASFGPRVPLRPVSEGYRIDAVPRAIQYLREHTEPGEAIFVPRAEPLIYFATETRNPTPYGGVIQGMRDEQQRVIVSALEDLRYVVMTDIDQPVYTYYRDQFPLVQAYLERHFHIPDDFLDPSTRSSWMLVLERGADRGPTAIDLIDSSAEGRRWVRGEDGGWSAAPRFDDTLATVQNRRLLPVVLGARGGGIDYDVDVPPNAVFQVDVGYPEATGLERVYPHPRRARMLISVGRDREFEVVASQDVRLKRALKAERRWTPLAVDLAPYAGQRIVLRLQVVPDGPLGERRVAWWGSPRIALRSASGG